MDKATTEFLVKLEAPYAKLSFLSDDELFFEGNGKPRTIEVEATCGTEPISNRVTWSDPKDFYDFIGECLSIKGFRKNSTDRFNRIAEEAVKLSPKAQAQLHQLLISKTTDFKIAHNRLGPKELDALCARIATMIDRVKATDAKAE